MLSLVEVDFPIAGHAAAAGAVAKSAAVAEPAADAAAGAEAAVPAGRRQRGIFEFRHFRGDGVGQHAQAFLNALGHGVRADEGFVRGRIELRAAHGPPVAAALALADFGHFHRHGYLRDVNDRAQPGEKQHNDQQTEGDQQRNQQARRAIIVRDRQPLCFGGN